MNCSRCKKELHQAVIHDVYVCFRCKIGWSGMVLRNRKSQDGEPPSMSKEFLKKILVEEGMPPDVASTMLT